jgi:hypothetical protein
MRRWHRYLRFAVLDRTDHPHALAGGKRDAVRRGTRDIWGGFVLSPGVLCGAKSEAAHTGSDRRHVPEGQRLLLCPVVPPLPPDGTEGLSKGRGGMHSSYGTGSAFDTAPAT